ncbi:ABC transporter substrate-binding protein [Rhizobium sp. SL86]|uniref:ABC transporter substrate-binding protein n=1 Tax=Rhizobium sp. SL86 TaxID=2995148 RepID=UPI00227341FF|nr:ABC transporter substrate-binding protein [Rhizobium sp. SL86]MCY1667818.1 ABC transporter substrate-binding protein [Rhizobium sp. SL86]
MRTHGNASTTVSLLSRYTLAIGLLCLTLPFQGTAFAVDMKTATIVLSTTDQDVSYEPYGPLAQQLGYFKDEGLNVTIETAGTSGQVMQLLLSGKAQFAMLGPDSILLAAAKGGDLPIKMIYVLIRKSIYTAAVMDGSPIQNFGDLAGKVVGMPALSTTLEAFTTIRMNDDKAAAPAKSVVETGYGVTSMEALKTGTIDAFIAWPGLFAAYQNAGYNLRLLPYGQWQNDYYGIGLVARNDYIAANPDIVQTIARGVAKSAVFIKTNPKKVVETFWKTYPTRAPLPGDAVDTAMKKELRILGATISQMRIDEFPIDFKWGSQDAATWQRHYDLLKKTGQIKTDFDPTKFFTNEFNAKANEFERAPIIEAAGR